MPGSTLSCAAVICPRCGARDSLISEETIAERWQVVGVEAHTGALQYAAEPADSYTMQAQLTCQSCERDVDAGQVTAAALCASMPAGRRAVLSNVDPRSGSSRAELTTLSGASDRAVAGHLTALLELGMVADAPAHPDGPWTLTDLGRHASDLLRA